MGDTMSLVQQTFWSTVTVEPLSGEAGSHPPHSRLNRQDRAGEAFDFLVGSSKAARWGGGAQKEKAQEGGDCWDHDCQELWGHP